MRRAVALILALVVAGLGAGIWGEYEFGGIAVPVGAGVTVGAGVAATLGGAGRWHGPVPGAVAALLAASSLLAAGWIDSDEGVEPYPPLAIVAALIGVVTALAVVGRRRAAVPPGSASGNSLDTST